uniref:Protein kinase domain-containing protein n=1 Tax=Steinernema glaseri TaxID=37863 RepID=A0A1I7ZJ44_9BILA
MQRVPEKWLIEATNIKLAKEKPIGSGNFADVYRGTFARKNKQKLAAIKIVRKKRGEESVTISEDETSCLAEMNNEALIMSLLQNPNVTEFFGISVDQMVMIVMEYCPGGSLDVHLQTMKASISPCGCLLHCCSPSNVIAISERVQYMTEICSGMKYLERKQVVHRDLATRNVLISASGQLKIADFGLSLSPVVELTRASSRNVPVRWMAPESLKKKSEFTSKSDVWSFGVLCFEIFNYGVKPWADKPVKWIATEIRRCHTPKMSNRTPRKIRELVQSCWKANPAERPSFASLLGLLVYMQHIRFGQPPAHKFSLNKLKTVTRSNAPETEDTESILIDLDYVATKSVEKEKDKKQKSCMSQALMSQMHEPEDKGNEQISMRSVIDLVPVPIGYVFASCQRSILFFRVNGRKSIIPGKKMSCETVHDNDDEKEDHANTILVTKETVDEMDPTEREK